MKTLLHKILLICGLTCSALIAVHAQEVTFSTSQFYYNPFDDNNLGVFNQYLVSGVGNKTVTIGNTTSTTFNNTPALTSVNGVNSKNNIYGQIIPSTSDRNLNNYDYEWTFLYKNNSSTNPIEAFNKTSSTNTTTNFPGPVNTGECAWRYWLNASDKDNTTIGIQGFYITQVGNNMVFRLRNNENDIQSLISFPITNNVLWTIKIQRLGTSRWKIWANPVSGSNYEASAYINQTDVSNTFMNTYAYSILETTDLRTSGNFYWDNLKLYTRRFSLTGINSAANGITQPAYYAGQSGIVLFGAQLLVRGTYSFNSINFGSTGASENAYLQNGFIVKSIDDYYNTSSDNTQISTATINDNNVQSGTFPSNDIYYTSGNADGSYTRVSDYYLVADVKPTLNYGNFPYGTFNFTGVSQLTTSDYNNPIPVNANNTTTGNNTIYFGFTYTWSGATSIYWNDPSNWLLNQVPPVTGTATVLIPGTGVTNEPSSQPFSYSQATNPIWPGTLTIASNRTLTMYNGDGLEIGKNLIGNGTINFGNSSNIYYPYGNLDVLTTTFKLDAGATATLTNLSINKNSLANTVTLTSSGTGTLYLSGTLTANTGTLAVSNGALTLTSTSAGSANISQINTSNFKVTGNVNVQRYMTGGVLARRGYRLLSAPVHQTATINSQQAYGFTDLQKTTPITGYGASGTAYNSLTPPTNGFDMSLSGNPSVLYYYEKAADPTNQVIANSDYKGLKSINELLPVGNGFLFFFRGNRNVLDINNVNKTTTTAIPENTTLNWTGVPNQGSITVNFPAESSVQTISGHIIYVTPTTTDAFFKYNTSTPASANDGLHLVGNPYASIIDLESITLTNPNNAFVYMLNNSGVFGVYSRGSNTQYTSATLLNNGVGRYVLPGQGFMIQGKLNNSTTLQFTEAAKVTNINVNGSTGNNGLPTTFKAHTPQVLAMANKGVMDVPTLAAITTNAAVTQVAQPSIVHITLSLDSDNMNETVIQFGDKNNPGNNKFNDQEDAIYRSGISQTTFMASYTADNKPCIINTMGAIDTIKSVPLYVEGKTDGLYKLKFTGASAIDSRYILYLLDHFMKDSLDLSANDTYKFTLQRGNSQTFGATRFELVKHKSGLQYNLLGFNGAKKTGSVVLNWKTEHEGTYTMFALQRSTDGGKTFITIDSLASDGSGNYTMTDVKPTNGTNQYRLVQTVGLDPSALSKIVIIGYQPPGNDNLIANFDLFPNPSVDIIKLRLNNITQGKLSIKIYNVDGRVVSNSKANAGGTISQDVSKLLHGGYVLEVSNADGSYYATKKFSKL